MRQSRAVLLAILVVSVALLMFDTRGKPSQIVQDIRDTLTDLRSR